MTRPKPEVVPVTVEAKVWPARSLILREQYAEVTNEETEERYEVTVHIGGGGMLVRKADDPLAPYVSFGPKALVPAYEEAIRATSAATTADNSTASSDKSAGTWDAPGRLDRLAGSALKRYAQACATSPVAAGAWLAYGGNACDDLEKAACRLARDCGLSVEEAAFVILATLLDRIHGGEVDPSKHLEAGAMPALVLPEDILGA